MPPPVKKDKDVVSSAASSSTSRLASLGSSSGSSLGAGVSSRGGATSVARGRFAPKVVARRSKQERDSTAPPEKPIKSEAEDFSRGSSGGARGRGGRGGSDRGRGAGRGGRGRGRFEPVTHAAAGALGAPSTFDPRSLRYGAGAGYGAGVGDVRSSRDSASPQAEFLASRLSSVHNSRSPSVDPDGMVAIDMSQSAPMAPDLSEFFPVRLEKRDEATEDVEEYERAEAAEHNKETERLARRRRPSRAQDPDGNVNIKQEDESMETDDAVKVEEDLRQLKVAPSTSSSHPHAAAKDKRPGHAGLAEEEASELRRIARDHRLIAKEFGMQSSHNIENSKDENTDPEAVMARAAASVENRLYFFQFPALMPDLVGPAAEGAATGDGDDLVEVTDPAAVDPSGPLPQGQLGKLRLHKSGKLTMVVGNITMEVSQGTDCSFLQDVVVVDSAAKQAHLIGQISKKMVLSPMFI